MEDLAVLVESPALGHAVIEGSSSSSLELQLLDIHSERVFSRTRGVGMKRRRVVVIIVGVFLAVIASAFFATYSFRRNEHPLADVTGVLIYDPWESYIFAHTGEEISIKIPVYDFSDELGGSVMSIKNLDIGEVTIRGLIPQVTSPYFKQYTLHFVLIPREVGLHVINDLTVMIQTPRHTYVESLGRWVFEVEEEIQENLEIRGGSGFTPHFGEYSREFHYFSTFKNISTREVVLHDLSVHSEKIRLRVENFFSLKPSQEQTFNAYVDISKTQGNVYVRPKLTYKVNGQLKSRTTSLMLYASTVPEDELLRLLKEKNMLSH